MYIRIWRTFVIVNIAMTSLSLVNAKYNGNLLQGLTSCETLPGKSVSTDTCVQYLNSYKDGIWEWYKEKDMMKLTFDNKLMEDAQSYANKGIPEESQLIYQQWDKRFLNYANNGITVIYVKTNDDRLPTASLVELMFGYNPNSQDEYFTPLQLNGQTYNIIPLSQNLKEAVGCARALHSCESRRGSQLFIKFICIFKELDVKDTENPRYTTHQYCRDGFIPEGHLCTRPKSNILGKGMKVFKAVQNYASNKGPKQLLDTAKDGISKGNFDDIRKLQFSTNTDAPEHRQSNDRSKGQVPTRSSSDRRSRRLSTPNLYEDTQLQYQDERILASPTNVQTGEYELTRSRGLNRRRSAPNLYGGQQPNFVRKGRIPPGRLDQSLPPIPTNE